MYKPLLMAVFQNQFLKLLIVTQRKVGVVLNLLNRGSVLRTWGVQSALEVKSKHSNAPVYKLFNFVRSTC